VGSNARLPKQNAYARADLLFVGSAHSGMAIPFIPGKPGQRHSEIWFLLTYLHLQTGYARPITEEDVWCLAESRQSKTVSQQLEKNFYARCPYNRRPLHLRGNHRLAEGTGENTEASCGAPSSHLDSIHGPETTRKVQLCDLSDTLPPNPGSHTAGQSTLGSTGYMLQDLGPTGVAKDTFRLRSSEDETPLQVLGLKLPGLRQRMVSAFRLLSRINPCVRISRRMERGDIVIEKDERGIERIYDSSLLKALVKTVQWRLLAALLLESSSTILFTTSSLLTKRLIAYIATSHSWAQASALDRVGLTTPQPVGIGIALAIALALMQEIGSIAHSHYQATAYTCGKRCPSLPSYRRLILIDHIRYHHEISCD
jgi:ATP-binding cassette subfamily C (CFTR/MRP) protein 1